MCILNVDPISIGTRSWCLDGHGIYNHVTAVVKPYMELSAVHEVKPFDSHFGALKDPKRLRSNNFYSQFTKSDIYNTNVIVSQTLTNHRTVTRTGLGRSVWALVRFTRKVPPFLATAVDKTRALN